MLALYRGHWIVLLSDDQLTAEISVLETREVLPTKVSATKEEGAEMCRQRARELIDVYLSPRAFASR